MPSIRLRHPRWKLLKCCFSIRTSRLYFATVEEGAVVTRMVYQNLGVLDEHAVHFPAFILPCSSTSTKATAPVAYLLTAAVYLKYDVSM